MSASIQSVSGRFPLRASSCRLQPGDEFGELAGQFDAVAADVVEGQRGAQPGLGVVGHRHPGQDAVDPEPPGVVQDVIKPVRLAVLLRRSPSGYSTRAPSR